MKKNKIMFVANSAWSMFRFRSEVLQDYVARGYHVTIVAPSDTSVDKIKQLGCDFLPFSMSRRSLNPFTDLWSFFQLLSLYFKYRPSFVFHYTIKPNIWGSFAANILGIKNIAVTTGLGYAFNKNSSLTRLVSIMYKLAFFRSEEVWFLNQDDREEFVKRQLISVERTFVLPSEGINIDEFAFEKEFPTTRTFLLVARMLWDKGVGEFVEVAKEIHANRRDVRFKLLGPIDNGNPASISLDEINSWQRSGIVEYLGETEDVRPFLRDSTCVILPTTYREGVPRVLLEAAATGRPIITYDAPGCREVVINGLTGLLVEKGDSTGLVAAVKEMINMPSDKIYSFGAAGRKLVEARFSIENVVACYRARY